MKIDPIPEGSQVTLTRVAKGINQLHECMEDQKVKTVQLTNAVEADRAQTGSMLAVVNSLHERLENIETFPMRVLRWIIFAVATSAVGTIGTNYILHSWTAQQAEVAAKKADVAATEASATSVQVHHIAKALGTEQ